MNDQAERLRQIIEKFKKRQPDSGQEDGQEIMHPRARVMTVTSGKGGVGKTNIAANLAIALSRMGKKVAVVDADFGLANIDVLLGITPRFTLLDVIKNTRNIIEVLMTGPDNIRFISGGSGVQELIELQGTDLNMFLNNISLLDRLFDIIIIDTGAGISGRVLSLVTAADETLLVTTPEPTAVTDAYALIKTLSRIEKDRNIKLIVNRADTADEAVDIQKRLKLVSDRFLGMSVEPIGYILKDETVVKAVKAQKPFLVYSPNSRASKQIMDISMSILNKDKCCKKKTAGFGGFVKKLAGMRISAGKAVRD